MSNTTNLNELIQRRTDIEFGGVEKDKQKDPSNPLVARDRINTLLDGQSFVEVGAFVSHRSTDFNMTDQTTPADGVVTGYGTIEGRLVYVYSQDNTVLKGALGEMHAKKISHIYELALKMGAPVIGLIDSAGLRLQESTDALHGFGELFLKQSLASGVIPQITAVLGNCGGGATFIPSLSDFTFMISKKAKLYVNSPNALDNKNASLDTVASAKFHSEESGMVDFVLEDENTLLASIRNLVDMLPANNVEEAPELECSDDLNRVSSELNNLDTTNGIDAKAIIEKIADNNDFVEVKANYATTMVTGFIRLNGTTIGVVANQTIDTDGSLSSSASEKAASFIQICDAFNIPLLSLTDATGFKATVEEETKAIAKSVSKMLYTFTNATVPKVNVLVGRGYGSAYIAMNSKHIGADFVLAWPSAKVSMMEASSAVKIMYADEINAAQDVSAAINEKTNEFETLQSSPYAAASRGYIDDIIEPGATRKRIIATFEMLLSKRENRPEKKHGTIL
ncbi:acetyl-CoA carboxylase carboxyltransferase component [Natranaerovirga hydrolytica]|uniref:Acetyl-CoA carboxylase carboxyltransferase component n=1 Tax=Natranaerovirga hydrolytica TaxID=680378 RepID=A0A4R1MXJ8_9FIRM|nr:carboxyl transferase domain-containing protein [Natranaerovirga hydrolytica]TCK97987.1 acetyl-CoA carboxylase carboxyltransferase component [Natranaerovirga hydrolytica]